MKKQIGSKFEIEYGDGIFQDPEFVSVKDLETGIAVSEDFFIDETEESAFESLFMTGRYSKEICKEFAKSFVLHFNAYL